MAMAYHVGSKPAVLAAIIPITSRGMQPGTDATQHLELMRTNLNLPRSVKIYFAIDTDDSVYTGKNRLQQAFPEHEVTVRKFAPQRPVKSWTMVNELVQVAFEDGCDYFIILGDDVTITYRRFPRNAHWFDRVQREFHDISTTMNLPLGFGCVALNDRNSPGFPTFPVVHRRHIKAMGIAFCHSIFINQDADPFVFEIYRRWNAARILHSVRVDNRIGGTQQAPRYSPRHVDWKNEVLHSAIACVRYNVYGVPPPTMITIDVVVPSYRLNIPALRRILRIKQPMDVATLFIIIIDNPNAHNVAQVQQFEREFLGRVRVRTQPTNLGASAARNPGIEKYAADWILFLDDDVVPDPNILHYYSQAIKSRGVKTCGFVGLTTFPSAPAGRISNAAYLSHSLFFWSISRAFPDQAVAWGVTANLLMRRTKVRYRTEFPRTGGGEDVAFCVDSKAECGLPLWSAAQARAVHPWWDRGSFTLVAIRFFKWALGDGLMLQSHPHLTYRVMPNVEEMTLLWAILIAPVLLQFGFAACLPALAVLVWVVDVCGDVCLVMTTNRHVVMPKLVGRRRLQAAFESTLVKAAVEFGHLWTQIRRLKVLNLCQRFDWFANLLPHETKKQQQQALVRFMWFTIPVIAFFYHSWLLIVFLVTCAFLMESVS